MFEELTQDQIIANHISAMQDSVTTLSQLLGEPRNEENDKRVVANYTHLELMIEKSELNLNNEQRTIFLNSINQAKSFVSI